MKVPGKNDIGFKVHVKTVKWLKIYIMTSFYQIYKLMDSNHKDIESYIYKKSAYSFATLNNTCQVCIVYILMINLIYSSRWTKAIAVIKTKKSW